MSTTETGRIASRRTIETAEGKFQYYSLEHLARKLEVDLHRLPYSIKVLLESALRNLDGFIVTEDDVRAIAQYNAADPGSVEVPFLPARVLLQDFTGVPAVVDLAALRDACRALGGDPRKINPLVPCDLVIDHSVQTDHYGSSEALALNISLEFERNRERYEFLKWGQQAFDNFRVVPPGMGIVHQVNLEYLARCVMVKDGVALPDSLVGTDSHTTMINGLGVVGWGVGGIEAEAVMLGQPIYMLLPKVVGFRLTGKLPEGATATDLVLTVTQVLREIGVVEQFVEFFGDGLEQLSLPDRATIANMAPEYGATIGFFPIDAVSLDYLAMTGRSDAQIELVEKYCKVQGLWRDRRHEPVYSRLLELDLSTVEPCLAGPRRPQDRIALATMKKQWRSDLTKVFSKESPTATATLPAAAVSSRKATGEQLAAATATLEGPDGVEVEYRGERFRLRHGDVVIAAITSCTNTSNPSVLIAAGLLARNAVEKGLTVKPWVKTSLAPGSRVVTDYLDEAGLSEYLDRIGFETVGYGCMTCIGNSGPLPEPIALGVEEGDLVVSAVLSGNRNFEGRINPHVRANYLGSPPLVVAYALAGTVDIDLLTEPLGEDKAGKPVFLKDVWPTAAQVRRAVQSAVKPEQFAHRYADVESGPPQWQRIESATGDLYDWDGASTYIQNPPFFRGMGLEVKPIEPIRGARALAVLGDSVTTDHISPAGSIKAEFNSYGARRGNHEVMMRGTFANIRVRNHLAPGTEGGVTTYLGPGAVGLPSLVMSIYDASVRYRENGIPLVVLAGKDYGMGSSRDWAAKGTYLLGVKAVIADSYERIHRSNLVGMGVLPLQHPPGQTRQTLDLTGHELFDIAIDDTLRPHQRVHVTATDPVSGRKIEFDTLCRIDTPVEITYYRNGGILHTVLRKIAQSG